MTWMLSARALVLFAAAMLAVAVGGPARAGAPHIRMELRTEDGMLRRVAEAETDIGARAEVMLGLTRTRLLPGAKPGEARIQFEGETGVGALSLEFDARRGEPGAGVVRALTYRDLAGRAYSDERSATRLTVAHLADTEVAFTLSATLYLETLPGDTIAPERLLLEASTLAPFDRD